MSRINLAIQLGKARQRAQVLSYGDVASSRIKEAHDTYEKSYVAGLYIARRVAAVIVENAGDSDKDPKLAYERVITDGTRDAGDRNSIEGWILAESIDDQKMPLRMSGLLLERCGAVYAYSADVPEATERRLAPDVWGRFRQAVPASSQPFEGTFSDRNLTPDAPIDPIDYAKTLHAASGPLDMLGLLAGVIVRHDLNEMQFIQ